MLLAGCIFALMKWWLCAVLLGVGALGCLSGAIGMKKERMREARRASEITARKSCPHTASRSAESADGICQSKSVRSGIARAEQKI